MFETVSLITSVYRRWSISALRREAGKLRRMSVSEDAALRSMAALNLEIVEYLLNKRNNKTV